MRSPLRELPSQKNARAIWEPQDRRRRRGSDSRQCGAAGPTNVRGDARNTNVSRVSRDQAPRRVSISVAAAPDATVDLPLLSARLYKRVVLAQQETTDREGQRAEPPCDGRAQESSARVPPRSSMRGLRRVRSW